MWSEIKSIDERTTYNKWVPVVLTVFDARSFNWIFLRLFTIELQVHLTLSALQAPAYSMSGVGRGVFSFLVIYEKYCIYGLCK